MVGGGGGLTFVTSALGGVKWSVSERSPRYQLNKMVCGPQHGSGRFGQGQLHVPINMSSTITIFSLVTASRGDEMTNNWRYDLAVIGIQFTFRAGFFFFFSVAFSSALGTIRLSVKRPVREADHFCLVLS